MSEFLPTPQPKDLPLKSIEDALAIAEDVVKRIRNGDITDPKYAEGILKGVSIFCNAYVAKQKHSPNQIAIEEMARQAARRAAESIDLKTAQEILNSRNFKLLEELGQEKSPVIEVKLKEDVRKTTEIF